MRAIPNSGKRRFANPFAARMVGAVLFSSILALPFASSTSADTFTYTYQGNSFTDLQNGYTCSPGPCDVQGSFTVTDQLAAGLVDATVTPIDWTFSDDNGNDWSYCGSLCITGLSVTEVNTDASGDITSWDVAVVCFGSSPLETQSSGGTSEDRSTPGCHPLAPAAEATNSGMPGTWTCTDNGPNGPSPCGPAPPAPEPSSLPLLGIGFLALAVAARRKLASLTQSNPPWRANRA